MSSHRRPVPAASVFWSLLAIIAGYTALVVWLTALVVVSR